MSPLVTFWTCGRGRWKCEKSKCSTGNCGTKRHCWKMQDCNILEREKYGTPQVS